MAWWRRKPVTSRIRQRDCADVSVAAVNRIRESKDLMHIEPKERKS
jgi:hypothetical protein